MLNLMIVALGPTQGCAIAQRVHEPRFHLERQISDYAAEGMKPEESRRWSSAACAVPRCSGLMGYAFGGIVGPKCVSYNFHFWALRRNL
jgi:hypothetical protein